MAEVKWDAGLGEVVEIVGVVKVHGVVRVVEVEGQAG